MAETPPPPEVKILPPDRSLLQKLGNVNLDQIFSDKAVATAQKVITDSSETLFAETLAGAKKLEELGTILRTTPAKANDIKIELTTLSFSMKASAALAGYDLVGSIAKSLNLVCEKLETKDLTPTNIQIILWHIDSLLKIVALKIKGTGGDAGAAIQKELDSIEKLFSKDKPAPIT